MKLVRVYESKSDDLLSIGMLFMDLNENINKKLGFFLMR